MISGEWQKVTRNDVRWPCGVCGRGIGNNSVYISILDIYIDSIYISKIAQSQFFLSLASARMQQWASPAANLY